MKKRPALTKTENLVYDHLTKAGCTVYRNGWPDFLCRTPSGKIIAVEVKRLKNKVKSGGNFKWSKEWLSVDPLSQAQEEVIELLEQVGLRCYIAQAHDDGLIRDLPDKFD